MHNHFEKWEYFNRIPSMLRLQLSARPTHSAGFSLYHAISPKHLLNWWAYWWVQNKNAP